MCTHRHSIYLYSGSPLKPVGFIAVHVFQKNPKELRGHFHVHTETLKDEVEHILWGVWVSVCVCVCVCMSVYMCGTYVWVASFQALFPAFQCCTLNSFLFSCIRWKDEGAWGRGYVWECVCIIYYVRVHVWREEWRNANYISYLCFGRSGLIISNQSIRVRSCPCCLCPLSSGCVYMGERVCAKWGGWWMGRGLWYTFNVSRFNYGIYINCF